MMYCDYTRAIKSLAAKITPSTDGHGKDIYLYPVELDALIEVIDDEMSKIIEVEKERCR